MPELWVLQYWDLPEIPRMIVDLNLFYLELEGYRRHRRSNRVLGFESCRTVSKTEGLVHQKRGLLAQKWRFTAQSEHFICELF